MIRFLKSVYVLLTTAAGLFVSPASAQGQLCVQCGVNSCYFANEVGFASCQVNPEGGTTCTGTCGTSNIPGGPQPPWWVPPALPPGWGADDVQPWPGLIIPDYFVGASYGVEAASSAAEGIRASPQPVGTVSYSTAGRARAIKMSKDDLQTSTVAFWKQSPLGSNRQIARQLDFDLLSMLAVAAIRAAANRPGNAMTDAGAVGFMLPADGAAFQAWQTAEKEGTPAALRSPSFGGYAEYRLVRLPGRRAELRINSWKVMSGSEQPVEGRSTTLTFRHSQGRWQLDQAQTQYEMPAQTYGRYP